MIRTTDNSKRVAYAYFARMGAAGVDPSAAQRSAVLNLLTALSGIGLGKFSSVYPFMGGSAASHALDLLGERDLTWSGGVVHSSNGSTGNGSDGYADTGFKLGDGVESRNSVHIGFYQRTSGGTNNGNEGGALDTANVRETTLSVTRSDSTRYFKISANGSSNSVAAAGTNQGFFVLNREVSTHNDLYQDGVRVSNAAKTSLATFPQFNNFLMARNNNGSDDANHNGTFAFWTIGSGLTSGEIATLNTAVAAYVAAAVSAAADEVSTAYLARVESAGGSPSGSEASAVTALFRELAKIGFSKFAAIYPFLGGSAATHALDALENYDITWSGTVTHDANGSAGNGSTGYGDTGIDLSTEITTTSGHLSAYVTGNTYGGTKAYMGCGGSGTLSILGFVDVGTKEGGGIAIADTSPDQYAPNDADADTSHNHLHAVNVGAARSQQYYRDGSAFGSPVTASGAFSSDSFSIMARNQGGTRNLFVDAQLKFVSIGSTLNSSEHLAFYNAIEAYQVALGREN